MDDREAARRELETKLLELLAEYQRVLREDFLAAREGARWRYRYAQEAQRDLEEATARAANLRERLGELREETERRRGRGGGSAREKPRGGGGPGGGGFPP